LDNWLAIVIIIVAALFMIGNFSTFQKSAKQPLRKKSLNDLTETLPRSKKTQHTMTTDSQKYVQKK
jgi:uncharacterized membrane protein YgcG